jgi:phospholipase C
MADTSGRGTAVTRREALRDIGAAGVAAGALGGGLDALLAQAADAWPHRGGSLKDIEHVIIFMQENRSFDHYFGTLSGVRGFADQRARKTFLQRSSSGRTIAPFRLPTQCLPDISHEWGPQHRSWNHGRMDGFVRAREPASVDGPAVAPQTMGYYTRADLRFYYGLADAFTLCDNYYCSVIGPTDPNRLMSMSASIDPDGRRGGPLLETLTATRSSLTGRFTWTTMPERLQAHGISWKVYQDKATGFLDNVLPYFKAYKPGSELQRRGNGPTYPEDFLADLAHDRLPKVSWLLANVLATEHPGFSTPTSGELVLRDVLRALFSHPSIWRKTALFVTWDENGGFFDHVAPPTPPPGTKGEYVTVPNLPKVAQGIRGPLGLGFRVPMLVISPFSRGGLVCSQPLDHTSTLRFLETRFGVEVPNLSSWRRRATGDLTGAFNFAAAPNARRPSLTGPSGNGKCASPPTPVPVPSGSAIPRQERGRRKRPSGILKR